MTTLNGKRILVGITGGIAVYKTCELIRLLVKAGAEVRVVATANAMEFITRVTLETLSRNTLELSSFPNDGKADPRHITLARWADLFVVAPASANLLAKYRCGIADDLLTTSLMAYTGKVLIAPAMNTAMWEQPATQENVSVLKQRGVGFVGPEFGFMAAANEQIGAGRMTEPGDLFVSINRSLYADTSLHDVPVLIVAGPTSEPIDAVRYISNRSTGTLGILLAECFTRTGAKVKLLLGDTPLQAPYGIDCERFDTVASLDSKLKEHLANHRVWVMAAAVSDRKPVAGSSTRKIKKTYLGDALPWEPTPDLLARYAVSKTNAQYVVGFALEDSWVVEEAQRKLSQKHVDLLVWNNPLTSQTGFGSANLEARLIELHQIQDLGIVSRTELADKIVATTIDRFRGRGM